METAAEVNDHQGTAAPTAADTGVLVETTTTVVMTTLTRKVRKREEGDGGGNPKELSDPSSSSSSSSSSSDRQNKHMSKDMKELVKAMSDSKRKHGKEADEVKLPALPTANQFRPYKTAVYCRPLGARRTMFSRGFAG